MVCFLFVHCPQILSIPVLWSLLLLTQPSPSHLASQSIVSQPDCQLCSLAYKLCSHLTPGASHFSEFHLCSEPKHGLITAALL